MFSIRCSHMHSTIKTLTLTSSIVVQPKTAPGKEKISIDRLCDFLFTDDCAINAGSVTVMYQNMDMFSSSYNSLGLTINNKKTQVVYQPAPG